MGFSLSGFERHWANARRPDDDATALVGRRSGGAARKPPDSAHRALAGGRRITVRFAEVDCGVCEVGQMPLITKCETKTGLTIV